MQPCKRRVVVAHRQGQAVGSWRITAPQSWEITNQELGLKSTKPFFIRLRTLHGGSQEGVCIVDIDTSGR
jgi:hypothetical protein